MKCIPQVINIIYNSPNDYKWDWGSWLTIDTFIMSSSFPLTHWGRDKMAAIFQTAVSNGFSWMKMYELWLKFHRSLFPRAQLTIFQHWIRQWLGALQATSYYLNQWWLVIWCIYALLSLKDLIWLNKRFKLSWISHPIISKMTNSQPSLRIG